MELYVLTYYFPKDKEKAFFYTGKQKKDEAITTNDITRAALYIDLEAAKGVLSHLKKSFKIERYEFESSPTD